MIRIVVALAVLLTAGAASAQQLDMVPVSVDGQTVRLAIRIYKPAGESPAPTLVFNHGSTGNGTSAEIAVRPIDFPQLAEFFVERGWAVVRTRVVMGGQSRGGILSVAYAGLRGEQMKGGVINFVGGWNGTRCIHASANNQALFVRGARYPGETLWLDGDEDPFYALAHSRANFAAFTAGGGTGTFLEFPKPLSPIGHRIVGFPEMWRAAVEAYLTRRGLPATVPSALPGSGR